MLHPRLKLRDLRHADLTEGRYELKRSPIRIGRGPRCEIRLHSEAIADVQVILRREGNRWLIHPVGPPEGSLCNGQFLTETAWLEAGTTLQIGHVELRLDQVIADLVQTPEEPLAKAMIPPPAAVKIPEPVSEVVFHLPEVSEIRKDLDVPVIVEQEILSGLTSSAIAVGRAGASAVSTILNEACEPISPSYLAEERPAAKRRPILSSKVSREPISPVGDNFLTNDIRRQSSQFHTHHQRASSPTVQDRDSLSQWVDDFSRRYPVDRLRNVQAAPALAEGMAYCPRPIPILPRANPAGILADPDFIEQGSHLTVPVQAALTTHQPDDLVVVEVMSPEPVPPVILISESVDEDWSQPSSDFHTETVLIDGTQELTATTSIVEPLEFESGIACEQPESLGETFDSNDLDPLGIACEKRTPYYLTERLSPIQFEEWLDSVGSILETIETESSAFEIVDSVTVDQYTDDFLGDPETESAEILIPPEHVFEVVCEIDDPPQILDGIVIEAQGGAGSLAETSNDEGTEALAEAAPVDDKSMSEWPSVHDILRWSADRESRYGDSEQIQHSQTESKEHVIEPRQILRMNVPAAIAICFLWIGGSAVLALASFRISSQEELTQQAVSAIMSANQAGSSPRLPLKQSTKLQETPSWWAISGDQIWWRATFMKLRETAGQSVPVSGEALAEVARERDPLLPAARLWSASRLASTDPQAAWSGLSRDVISLMAAADHFRRIGDEQKANSADKSALELATAVDRTFHQSSVVFDAELGTGRFLLPGQSEVLVILKRLVKEPNFAEIVMSVVPEDRPEIWLTAAQIMKQSATGDPTPLMEKVMAWKSPAHASLNRRYLDQATRAEALALSGQALEAAQAYKSLTQSASASVWRRSWYFNHGELSSQNQNGEAAIASWRKARGDDPNHEVDRHAIQASRSLTGNLSDASTKNEPLRTN